ncbi:MAG: TonB-dependent receptor plug domain-containing protein [Bacteroidota bacterium]
MKTLATKIGLLFILIFQLNYCLKAQEKLAIDYAGRSLNEALELLSEQYDLKFSYDSEQLEKYSISRQIKTKTIEGQVNKLFKNLPFNIDLIDGIYLIIPKVGDIKNRLTRVKVVDQSTGKPLPYAHVFTDNNSLISDQNGVCVFKEIAETINVSASYIGYKQTTTKISAEKEQQVIYLEEDPFILKELILSTNKYEIDEVSSGFFSLNPERFDDLPSLGEVDVFKTLQLLPGVKGTDESTAGLFIRGGTPFQNLVQMDGFTIYHTEHFFGIFSVINPFMIDNVNLYKSTFHSKYGGRVSSVIDITGKESTQDKVSFNTGVNFLSLSNAIAFPVSEKTSVIAGARYSFTDLIETGLFRNFLTTSRNSYLEAVDPGLADYLPEPSFNFYDVNSKISHRVNDKHLLDFNIYVSRDDYKGFLSDDDSTSVLTISDDINQQNLGFSINLKSYYRPNWYSINSMSYSDYSDITRSSINQVVDGPIFSITSESRLLELERYENQIENTVKDISFKSQHELIIDSMKTVYFGAEINSLQTKFKINEAFVQFFIRNSDSVEVDNQQQSMIYNLYAATDWHTGNFYMNAGLRGGIYSKNSTAYIDPRVSASYFLSKSWSFKGAFSIHHQFMNYVSRSLFENNTKFYWQLADFEQIDQLKSYHYSAGFLFNREKWTIDLEYFHHRTNGILENTAVGNSFVLASPTTLTLDDLSGFNISEGIDMLVKYKNKSFSSWISYSLNYAKNRFPLIDEGEFYPANFLQRHEMNFVANYQLNHWNFSLVNILGSGRQFSTPTIINQKLSYTESSLATEQLDPYERVDIAIKYSLKIKKAELNFGISVFNALNTNNLKNRRFNRRHFLRSENGGLRVIGEPELVSFNTELLSRTPNLFFTARF